MLDRRSRYPLDEINLAGRLCERLPNPLLPLDVESVLCLYVGKHCLRRNGFLSRKIGRQRTKSGKRLGIEDDDVVAGTLSIPRHDESTTHAEPTRKDLAEHLRHSDLELVAEVEVVGDLNALELLLKALRDLGKPVVVESHD